MFSVSLKHVTQTKINGKATTCQATAPPENRPPYHFSPLKGPTVSPHTPQHGPRWPLSAASGVPRPPVPRARRSSWIPRPNARRLGTRTRDRGADVFGAFGAGRTPRLRWCVGGTKSWGYPFLGWGVNYTKQLKRK